LIGEEKPYTWADRCGVNRGTLHAVLNKGANIRSDQLARICKTTGVSADWLLTGEGPMHRKDFGMYQSREADSTPKNVSGDKASYDISKKSIDPFLRHISERLDELEKKDPGIRTWFNYELRRKYPEIAEEEEKAVTAGEEEPGVVVSRIFRTFHLAVAPV